MADAGQLRTIELPNRLASSLGENRGAGSEPSSSSKNVISSRLDATVLVEPSDTPDGRRAVVKDFEGHKVELYEKRKDGSP